MKCKALLLESLYIQSPKKKKKMYTYHTLGSLDAYKIMSLKFKDAKEGIHTLAPHPPFQNLLSQLIFLWY